MSLANDRDITADTWAEKQNAQPVPDFAEVQSQLGWTRTQWEITVGRRKDMVTKHGVSYFVNVSSLRQIVEDTYDDFVEDVRQNPSSRLRTVGQMYRSFHKQLRKTLKGYIVVINTGTYYSPDEQTAIPAF